MPWRLFGPRRHPPTLPLESVRRRLELLLRALHGREFAIEPLTPPAPRGLLRRLLIRGPRHLRGRDRVAQSDATTVRLPLLMDAEGGEEVALARYRLLALGHAQRIVRGTASLAPGDDTPLERDLYLLRESVSADAELAASLHTAGAQLREARAEALASRPGSDALTAIEREVEAMTREALASSPEGPPDAVPASSGPAESLEWARATARTLRANATGGTWYRGVAPTAIWGTVRPQPPAIADPSALPVTDADGGDAGAASDVEQRVSPSDPMRGADPQAGLEQQWQSAMREASAHSLTEVQLGPDGATTDVLNDAGANLVRAEGEGDGDGALDPDDSVSAPVDIGDPDDPVWRARTVATLPYHEWDHRAARHLPRAVTVRVVRPPDADGDWAARNLREHAALVRQVRQHFERLRARRIRLSGQRDGEEIDVSACVRDLVERRTGHPGDDRLYVAVRPARRPIAILLLADVSGSTELPVAGDLRIVDVERIALLLAAEALEAMGDPYAMLAFSGRGANDVRIATVKDFRERHGEAVRRRVSALEPRGNTRLGAALRHASAMLANQPAGHRLLLLLSDGQPNDADRYVGDYGVEDSRQAVHEARAKGVFPFCLTVDREGPEYLPRIFGAAGHTILRHPEQLPQALLQVVKSLVVE